MGTRSLVTGLHAKAISDHQMKYGNVEIKKEFKNKKKTPDDEIKEYAETAMNELLGWYGYDKVDSKDTQGLNLHHFAANKTVSTKLSPPDTNLSSTDVTTSEEKNGALDKTSFLSGMSASPFNCIICCWCSKVVSYKMFSMKTPEGEKSFCSEMCFAQCRRANFKRNKTCDWCRHIRHTVSYVDFQDGEHQLQFCSDKCLNQYKMNIFCTETEAHLQLHPHLQGLGSENNGSGKASVRLITPELWFRDCRSESPVSERSNSPPDYSSPLALKAMSKSSSETQGLSKTFTIELGKLDKKDRHRDNFRKTTIINKNKKQKRLLMNVEENKNSSTFFRKAELLRPPKSDAFLPLLHKSTETSAVPLVKAQPEMVQNQDLSNSLFLPLGHFPPTRPTLQDPPPNSENYEQNLRLSMISPPSPSAPSVIKETQEIPVPAPPKSLIPPVTILVPYPVALTIPIPLPIPIPIPLISLKNRESDSKDVKLEKNDEPDIVPLNVHNKASSVKVPRPLRKRKQVSDTLHEETDELNQKAVPV